MPTIDFSRTITAEAKAAAATEAKAAALRARRNRAIAAGITVAGITVQTDDLSQGRITGAALQAVLDPGVTIRWKTPAGHVDLDARQILAIARAVRAHVQACFDHEARLIAGGTIDSDIDGGWPGGA